MKIQAVRRVVRRRWKTAILVATVLFLSLGLYSPIKTVKGLVVRTGLPVTYTISMDEGRIAVQSSSSTVNVYDITSGTNVTFPGPAPGVSFFPVLSGNRIVITGNLTILTSTIYYCGLPLSSTLQKCGPWEIVAKGTPGASPFGAWGFPMSHGDLIVWPVTNGFAYWRFSSGVTTTVSTAAQPFSVSTNGEMIAFSAKPTPSSPSFNLMYFDTSDAGKGVVNTGLPSGEYSTSVSQEIIAFEDNSSGTPNRIRYYNILTNQASPAGTGPMGNLAPTYYSTPTIWGDRVVFNVAETASDFNFDCDGNKIVSSSEFCLRYWNINTRSFEQPLLVPSAAPPLTVYPAIYDKIIAFKGSDGNLQYVTVPMQGDVDLDGKVDATDKNIVLNCLGQVLNGATC